MEENIAFKYLTARVETYLCELEKHDPTYLVTLRCKCDASVSDKDKADRFLFEFQELAEDLTGAMFDEEEELKRHFGDLKAKDVNEAAKFSIMLQRFVQFELENQLLNKKRSVFVPFPFSAKQSHCIVSTLAKLKCKAG